MEKMDLDNNVVDLSISNRRDPSLTITPATVRDLRALTTSGLTITPAPASVYRTESTANANATEQRGLSVSATHVAAPGVGGDGSGGPPAPLQPPTSSVAAARTGINSRRVLRPRTEPRSYAETPDIVLLPAAAKVNGNGGSRSGAGLSNGNYDSDSDDCEVPPLYPIKELTPAEIEERDQSIRKLKEELRGEETKLVLLKKLKQSQQLKDGITVLPANTSMTPSNQQQQTSATPLLSNKSSLSVTPSLGSSPSSMNQQPQPAHLRSNKPATVLRGQPLPARSGVLPAPRSSLPGGATLTPGPAHRSSQPGGRQPNVTITPSVTITPTSAPPQTKVKSAHLMTSNSEQMLAQNTDVSICSKPAPGSGQSSGNLGVTITPSTLPGQAEQSDRPREDGQTPAQRQAAAKLALRKQLEKTLLQIPPPKPPPPEMHFIPNPSNTEFVYLLGLEHVVDFITKERKGPPAPEPFRCQQCRSDFTPVWKWEKQGKHRPANATFQNPQGKDPRVICEQCVTSNVKKALKAEHTNRLKTAFVKALQQEQEIEQRLTTSTGGGGGTNNSSSGGQMMGHHHQSHHNRSSPSPSALSALPPGVTATVVEPPGSNHHSPSLPPPSSAPPGKSAGSSSSGGGGSSSSHRHAPTPPARHTPPPSTSSRSRHSAASLDAANLDKAFLSQGHLGALSSLASLGGLGNLGSMNNSSTSQQQATMQALHNQLLRGMFSGLSQAGLTGNSSHMLPFSQLLYPYQLAIAQAAGLGKSGVPNLADMQRAAELQRQYLLDMIPPQGSSNQRQNNWKT